MADETPQTTEQEPMCNKGFCGERAYCQEAQRCLATSEPEAEKDPLVKVLVRHRFVAVDTTEQGFCAGPYCAGGVMDAEQHAEHLAAMIRGAIPEPDNHHNAALCPYCQPISSPASTEPAKTSGEPVDLLAALQRSINAAKAGRPTSPGQIPSGGAS